MISKRKVRFMARTAMYEKNQCTQSFPKAKYYKSDYLGLHMWITAVAVTVAYFIILALVIACNFERIINKLTDMNYTALAIILVSVYVAMMAFFMVVSYLVFSYRYVESENDIKVYQNRIHRIFLMNKADIKNKGGKA